VLGVAHAEPYTYRPVSVLRELLEPPRRDRERLAASPIDVRGWRRARGRRLRGWRGHRADGVNHAPGEDCGQRFPADEDHNERALLHGVCDSPCRCGIPSHVRRSRAPLCRSMLCSARGIFTPVAPPSATLVDLLPRTRHSQRLFRARHLQPPVTPPCAPSVPGRDVPRIWHSRPTRYHLPPKSHSARPASTRLASAFALILQFAPYLSKIDQLFSQLNPSSRPATLRCLL